MKNLRLLTITFDAEIPLHLLSAFRGAVIEKVGWKHEHFHNHNNQPDADSQYHYRYPLVQYKSIRRKAALLFVDAGVDEAQHFFSQPDWSLTFGGEQHQMGIEQLIVKQYELKVTDHSITYRIRRFLPFNQRNYEAYQQLDDLKAQVEFLEKILVGNIHAFANGVDWRVEGWIDLAVTDIERTYSLRHKQVKRYAFDLCFRANILLPPFIGLGKGVSHGFGVTKKLAKRKVATE